MFPPSTSPPAVKIIALSSSVLSLSVIVTVVATVAVEAVPVRLPVTLPSMLATSVPVVMLRLPVLLALDVVVPSANLSSDSSHIKSASLPVDPLSIIIPTSLEFELAPLFKPNRLITEVKIKLESLDYMSLMREVENITNVGGDPNSKRFSIDIDNVTFIFLRD